MSNLIDMISCKRCCTEKVNPVGYRFWPTDNEIFDHYLRLKNIGDTSSNIDEVMNTLDIYSFDPWELPLQSKIKSEDKVWYFFSRKENKYKKGERQGRKTKSGYWKKTGVTMHIMSKRSGRSPNEMIGEKRVLVFHTNKNLKGSKSDWVMHEYQSVSSSPSQMITYTICKVQFKGEASDNTSPRIEANHSHTLTTQMNNIEELTSVYEGSSLDQLHVQGLQDPCPLCGVLNVQQETQHEDPFHQALSSHGWKSLLDFCNNISKPKL